MVIYQYHSNPYHNYFLAHITWLHTHGGKKQCPEKCCYYNYNHIIYNDQAIAL